MKTIDLKKTSGYAGILTYTYLRGSLFSLTFAGVLVLLLLQKAAPEKPPQPQTNPESTELSFPITEGCDGAIDLDGWNDRIAISDNATLTMGDEITIEAWVYFQGSSNIGNLVMKGNYGYGIAITGSGYIEWWRQFTQTLGPNSANPIPLNKWTHIAVAVGEGKTRFYINGELDNEVDEAIIRNRSGALYLGTQGSGCLCNNLDGRIDEFRVWNTVRTQSEIECNMNTCTPEGEGLIVHLGFDDGPGSTIASDASGNGNHGQLANMNASSDWVDGYSGVTAVAPCATTSPDCQNRTLYLNEAGSVSLSQDSVSFSPSEFSCEDIPDNTVLQFDGNNDFVNLGTLTPSIVEGDFTVESYFRMQDSATRGLINAFNSNTGGWAIMQDGTELKFIWGTNSNPMFFDEARTDALALNRWYHVAGVKQGNTIKIYIDGVLVQSAETYYSVPNLPVYLGRRYINLNNGWFHKGAVDELRIWNTARSQSEIQEQMTTSLQGDEPNLVAYYDFEDGSGSTVLTDKTSNANEGSLMGMDAEEAWEKGGPEVLNTVTVTVTSEGSDCQIQVTIVDTIAPVIVCKDTTLSVPLNGEGYIPNPLLLLDTLQTMDNCGISDVQIEGGGTITCEAANMEFLYTITAEDESGNTSTCESTVQVLEYGLPPKHWRAEDIGDTYQAGAYWYYPCEHFARVISTTDGVYDTGEEDALSYLSRTVCGPIVGVQARIDSISGEGYGGLMLRQTTEPGSPQVSILTSGSGLLRMEYRKLPGASKEIANLWAPFSKYFRLVKHPDRVEVMASQNGMNFQIIGLIDIQMGDCINAGAATIALADGQEVITTLSKFRVKTFAPASLAGPVPAAGHVSEAAPLSLDVFPNPGGSERVVRLSRPLRQAAQLVILNELGQCVKDVPVPAEQQHLGISLRGLSRGVFIIHLMADGGHLATPLRIVNID
ncbi:MAG: LamG domain-containing protein [Phaeodactylibacter xiamenensis]|uniref:LamG-like jellyroll fold domain-containing protein n=1 Tax=Phaeodactylibacter xiamenensis TaxID=1524460 RepID=A0A098S063_9BACT|nr:LamG domain-containing protein [Phaeodactylibacter xiamenensis]KGE85511.1 hypothetical protein IX84_27185 [Phaeodactylibacter xiamenensis]MCR9053758.1 LamG domain-containing protein [bacterium]